MERLPSLVSHYGKVLDEVDKSHGEVPIVSSSYGA